MENTFRLTVTTPDGNVFDEQIAALFLRGADGDLAILARYIPFVTTVKAGKCRIEFEDATEKVGTVDGGILSVDNEKTTLISSSFKFE